MRIIIWLCGKKGGFRDGSLLYGIDKKHLDAEGTRDLHVPDKPNTRLTQRMRRDERCHCGKCIIRSERSRLKIKRRWPRG
ncbi:hypothetical protein COMA2_130149 [Candidatus Nitrospira nitrificans]|uniref:Uncharacterized protein n=1 Tax=Candidatus Nitrospira nitrificans TaxID=1742973 RepID=A0A0S4L7C5_9BACT|nr:hypothetical protein COMA2_130149 [Candidatus Nitrospira nitrificans]